MFPKTNKISTTKTLVACFLAGVLCINAIGQIGETAQVTGTVYDANGAVIVGARVSATDSEGKQFDALTNQSGVYILKLPILPPVKERRASFLMPKYSISAVAQGFTKTIIREFRLVGTSNGKMNLDIALDVGGSFE